MKAQESAADKVPIILIWIYDCSRHLCFSHGSHYPYCHQVQELDALLAAQVFSIIYLVWDVT